jgi:hypothetical protein
VILTVFSVVTSTIPTILAMSANLFMGGTSSGDDCGDYDCLMKYGKGDSKLVYRSGVDNIE